MDDDQQFCLRWNNHQSTLISVFDTLLENGTLVDCTLAAEGKFLKAHKVVLSACSPYFAALLSQQYDKHPIFILKDIKFQELRAMMDYMYRGEVNISQDQLAALLKAAESLQIKGLSESRGGGGSTQKNENVVQKQPVPVVSKSGLTIEHKRPANKQQHPTSAATESDVSMSREGSTSPTSRKRKKFRRRSIEVNNMDNHELSNSSSQSQSIHMTSIPMTAASQITSATSSSSAAAANVLNVTKKTDHHDSKKDMEQSHADDDDEDDDKNDHEPPAQRQKHDMDVSHIKEKMQSTHSELLIEPKNEYDDGQDETVEDLTLEDDELLEDLDQAGPSHGGEGSSQGYAQWQVGQNQDEVFLAAQEAAGQHRDAQEKLTCTPSVFFNSDTAERFFCTTCGKNYLRKRHLQRHKRDECIGIPPRFECELCPSKFRRKYHLVRHLNTRHGIPPVIEPKPKKPKENIEISGGGTALLTGNAVNNFSVDAIMMKNEEKIPDIHFLEDLQKKWILQYPEALLKSRQIQTLNF